MLKFGDVQTWGKRRIARKSDGGKKAQLKFKLLDLSVYIQVYASAERLSSVCVCVCIQTHVHVQTFKEVLSCSSTQNFPSLQTSQSSRLLPSKSFSPLCLPRLPSLPFPCCSAVRLWRGRHHLVYMAWRMMWDHGNASICSGLLCSKDSIKK